VAATARESQSSATKESPNEALGLGGVARRRRRELCELHVADLGAVQREARHSATTGPSLCARGSLAAGLYNRERTSPVSCRVVILFYGLFSNCIIMILARYMIWPRVRRVAAWECIVMQQHYQHTQPHRTDQSVKHQAPRVWLQCSQAERGVCALAAVVSR
jgi:hypothetical protein